MAELVRVAALTGYFPTMAALGTNPAPLLREVGLSRSLLVDPEHVISARSAMRLLERSAEVTGCMTFGLRMAECRGLADIGATSLLIAHQATLRDVLAALAHYGSRINSTLRLTLDDLESGALIRAEHSLSEPQPVRQSADVVLGVLMRLCASVLGPAWAPELICFMYEPPPPAELAVYHRVFRCRPQFDSDCYGMVLGPSDLSRPNLRADHALARHARSLIDKVMSPDQRRTAEEVEHAIMLLLPTGRANVQNCAESLGLTVRTMQRMLDAEHTSFSTLLTKVRKQLAGSLLANRRMRVTDIADMLGYGSIAAFTRWHAQAFGMSPREARKSRKS